MVNDGINCIYVLLRYLKRRDELLLAELRRIAEQLDGIAGAIHDLAEAKQ